METKEPDSEEVTIEDMMRVAGWKQAYNQGQRHFHEQRHTRSIAKWFNSCRFFAPYYALTRLFKFEGKQWEKAFLILTRNEFFSGSLYVKGSLNRPIDPTYEVFNQENSNVPLGVNIFGIFWKWYDQAHNYNSLHYFVLVNLDNTNFICFQSWSDGTTCKKPEKRVWTRTKIALLCSLTTQLKTSLGYTLVLQELFDVNITTQFTQRFVIRYLSEHNIKKYIGGHL